MLRACVQSILPMAISSFHLFSCVWLCATPGSAVHQDSFSITNSQSLLKFKSIESSMPSKHLILSYPLLIGLHSFLASGSFPMRQFFASGGQRTGVSASASVFRWIFRTDFLLDGLVGSPWSPRDSQESSPTPQFKSINSSVLSFLHSPTLTSIHDYWKIHSFDWMDHCWQSNVSAF